MICRTNASEDQKLQNPQKKKSLPSMFRAAIRILLPSVLVAGAALGEQVSLTGKAVPGMESADQAYRDFMKRHGIPGASVAIMKNGRLVYARGFGRADVKTKKPVQPGTLFRIASISKPITALAVVHLVEQGKISYDLKVFPYLSYPTPRYAGAKRDPRLDSITVRHLLQHSGGWNRDTALDPQGERGFDPMFYPRVAAKDLTGRDLPPAPAESIARWMVGKPLQFDPGTGYAYSNLGYCVLGRVIEKASGQRYEPYLRSLLAKAGITDMHIGGGDPTRLRKNESRYFPNPSDQPKTSAWNQADTPAPYRHSISTMDAHGGWIANPSDLIRFTTLLDGRPGPTDLVGSKSLALIHARPSFAPPASEKNNYYGFGWSIWERKDARFRNWFHSGSLPGTMSMLIRSDNGITWAAVFNLRPKDSSAAFKDLDATMWKAVRGVRKWPE
jgi:N-acyl-D-amino-acid deacylase